MSATVRYPVPGQYRPVLGRAVSQVLGGLEPTAAPTQVDLTPAVETDLALALAPNVRVASEADAAQVLVVTKTIVKALVEATETDSAPALVPNIRRAAEVDAALALAPNIRVADEQDTAAPLIPNLRPAFETDSAEALTFTQAGAEDILPGAETDLAVHLDPTVRAAVETDLARILLPFKAALEADQAQPLTFFKQATLSAAAETDSAQALTRQKQVALAVALELDEATGLVVVKPLHMALVEAAEIDEAQQLFLFGLLEPGRILVVFVAVNGAAGTHRAVTGLAATADTQTILTGAHS